MLLARMLIKGLPTLLFSYVKNMSTNMSTNIVRKGNHQPIHY